jgi:hypothetical protein
MAGIALYGCIDDLLVYSSTIRFQHRLEQVKLLSDEGQSLHAPNAFGVVTAEAVAPPEIAIFRVSTRPLHSRPTG